MSRGGVVAEAQVLPTKASDLETRLHRRVLIQVALAVVVVTGLLVMLEQTFLPPPPRGARLRSSFARSAEGYFALHALCSQLGYRTQRSHASYARLPEPAEGATLLLLDPLSAQDGFRFDAAQGRALRDWTERGGHVVLSPRGAATLYWHGMPAPVPAPEVEGLEHQERPAEVLLPAGVSRGKAPAGGTLRWTGSEARTLLALPPEPRPPLGAFLHVDADAAAGALPECDVFDGGLPDDVTALVRLDDAPWVVHTRLGRGAVWAFATGLPLCNYGLGRLDMAPLVAGILHQATAHGQRAVWFDEYCHGLQAGGGWLSWITGPQLRYAAATLVLLAVAWGMRSIFRVGPARPLRTLPRRAKEEFVLALADLMGRAGRYRAAAMHLIHYYAHAQGGPGAGPTAAACQELQAVVEGTRTFDAAGLRDIEQRLRALQAASPGRPTRRASHGTRQTNQP